MPTQEDKKVSENKKQNNVIKKPLPSGTVTTIRSAMFELGSTNKTKKD